MRERRTVGNSRPFSRGERKRRQWIRGRSIANSNPRCDPIFSVLSLFLLALKPGKRSPPCLRTIAPSSDCCEASPTYSQPLSRPSPVALFLAASPAAPSQIFFFISQECHRALTKSRISGARFAVCITHLRPLQRARQAISNRGSLEKLVDVLCFFKGPSFWTLPENGNKCAQISYINTTFNISKIYIYIYYLYEKIFNSYVKLTIKYFAT